MGGISIFLSYASEDLERVRPIYNVLTLQGYHVWFDKERLLAGQDWSHEIEEAISKCDFFCPCLSIVSVRKSGYVQREFEQGKKYHKKKPKGSIYLLPIRLEDCNSPEWLKDIQHHNLFTDQGMNKLLEAVENGIAARGLAGFKFYINEGPDAGKYFRYFGSSINIGRSPDSIVVLRDPRVSASHGRLEKRRDKVIYIHQAGEKPTVLTHRSGKIKLATSTVSSHVIQDGDLLRMGDTEINVSFVNIDKVAPIDTTKK